MKKVQRKHDEGDKNQKKTRTMVLVKDTSFWSNLLRQPMTDIICSMQAFSLLAEDWLLTMGFRLSGRRSMKGTSLSWIAFLQGWMVRPGEIFFRSRETKELEAK